ncbi:MAG: hypothetical protein ACI4U2_05205, partial [Christensenellaceae bacterium]
YIRQFLSEKSGYYYRGEKIPSAAFAAFCIERVNPFNRCLWFKDVPQNDQDTFWTFASVYAESIRKRRSGLPIVVELTTAERPPRSLKTANLCVIRADEYLTKFDTRLFAYHIVQGLTDLTAWQKTYLATFCAEVFENDVKTSATLVDQGYAELVIHSRHDELLEKMDFTSEQREKMVNDLWLTQLNCFFPMIESIRREIIEKNRELLDQLLQWNEVYDTNFADRQRILDCRQLEIIQLNYIAEHMMKDECGNEEVYLQRDRGRIGICHRMRNMLAHMKAVSCEDLELFWQLETKD